MTAFLSCVLRGRSSYAATSVQDSGDTARSRLLTTPFLVTHGAFAISSGVRFVRRFLLRCSTSTHTIAPVSRLAD